MTTWVLIVAFCLVIGGLGLAFSISLVAMSALAEEERKWPRPRSLTEYDDPPTD